MKPVVRILAVIAGLVVALAVAAAVAVAVLFDPKDYQPLLASKVEEATGRKFTLAGELGLDFFPCCSVTLGRTALGNPPGFPDGEFASVESAALSLKVWPLIARREVKIGTVRLQGLNANLLVRADGAANWEFESDTAAESETADEGPGAGDLAIDGIEISAGRIAYRDEQEKSNYLAENFALETGDLKPGEPFDLKLSTKVTDQSDGTAGTVTLAAKATLDPDLSRVTLAKPLFEISAAGKAIPVKSLRATVGAAELAIEAGDATIFQFRSLESDFNLTGLEAPAGEVEGSFAAGDARLTSGASTELSLPKLDANFTITGKDIPGDTISATVKAKTIALDVDKVRGSVETMAADIDGLGAKLEVAGGGLIAESGSKLAGTLRLEPLSPRSVLAVLKKPAPETADPAAFTRLAGTADWALGEDSLRLQKMDFRLDDTHMTGSFGITNFDKPATSFDLRLDAMDLDRYLSPAEEGAGPPSGGKESGGGSSGGTDIPVDTIRDLRLDGRVQVEKLTFAKILMTGVSAAVRAADGRLRLDPLVAKLYGGEYRGAVTIDASGERAQVALDQQISALQVGSVLKDRYQNDKLTGALTGRIIATGSGNSSDDILKTLGGNVAVSLADGAYLGTDLWHEIRSARARIRGDAPPPAPADPRTTLNAMELGGSIADGVLRTDKLLAEIPFIRLTGAGALGIVDRTMDFRLQAQVFETPTFEDGSSIKDLTGIAIPLTLKGPMDAPKVGVDLKNLAQGVATQKLKDRLIKKLGIDEPAPPPDGADSGATGEEAQPAAEPPKEEKPRDVLKRGLRDLLKQ